MSTSDSDPSSKKKQRGLNSRARRREAYCARKKLEQETYDSKLFEFGFAPINLSRYYKTVNKTYNVPADSKIVVRKSFVTTLTPGDAGAQGPPPSSQSNNIRSYLFSDYQPIGPGFVRTDTTVRPGVLRKARPVLSYYDAYEEMCQNHARSVWEHPRVVEATSSEVRASSSWSDEVEAELDADLGVSSIPSVLREDKTGESFVQSAFITTVGIVNNGRIDSVKPTTPLDDQEKDVVTRIVRPARDAGYDIRGLFRSVNTSEHVSYWTQPKCITKVSQFYNNVISVREIDGLFDLDGTRGLVPCLESLSLQFLALRASCTIGCEFPLTQEDIQPWRNGSGISFHLEYFGYFDGFCTG